MCVSHYLPNEKQQIVQVVIFIGLRLELERKTSRSKIDDGTYTRGRSMPNQGKFSLHLIVRLQTDFNVRPNSFAFSICSGCAWRHLRDIPFCAILPEDNPKVHCVRPRAGIFEKNIQSYSVSSIRDGLDIERICQWTHTWKINAEWSLMVEIRQAMEAKQKRRSLGRQCGQFDSLSSQCGSVHNIHIVA